MEDIVPTPPPQGDAVDAPGGARVALTLVVSVFNEEAMLPRFLDRLRELLAGLGAGAECIFVDDGSTDGSHALLAQAVEGDGRLRLLSLSRNFGHEAAMVAGLDHARGESVICLDADLQHPLEEVPRMLSARRDGHDVVTMSRSGSRLGSWLFYKVLNLISPEGFDPDASDFFLVSRRVADVLRSDYRERVRFLRGFIQVVGFRKTCLRYHAPDRAGGESKYGLRKLFNLSLNALFCFSNLPLRIGVLCGAAMAGVGAIVGVYSLVMKWLGDPPSGYTTIVVLLCFLFSVQFILTGIIGEYVGYIFAEVKGRPLYLLDRERSRGLPPDGPAPQQARC
jgi:polyisoprenyl-phosphate glycosyltransferase